MSENRRMYDIIKVTVQHGIMVQWDGKGGYAEITRAEWISYIDVLQQTQIWNEFIRDQVIPEIQTSAKEDKA